MGKRIWGDKYQLELSARGGVCTVVASITATLELVAIVLPGIDWFLDLAVPALANDCALRCGLGRLAR